MKNNIGHEISNTQGCRFGCCPARLEGSALLLALQWEKIRKTNILPFYGASILALLSFTLCLPVERWYHRNDIVVVTQRYGNRILSSQKMTLTQANSLLAKLAASDRADELRGYVPVDGQNPLSVISAYTPCTSNFWWSTTTNK
jgi:hypothetical protein